MTHKDTRTWRDKYEAQKKYDAQNVIVTTFKLFKKTDTDIISFLSIQNNKAGFIKNALRYYIANGCPVPEAKEEEGEAE